MSDFGSEDGRDGQILEFDAARRSATHPTVQQVEAYWERQRKGRIVPSRSDIEPLGLERTLAHVFIAERISKGLARFRIAGSHMNELIGLDVRGMPVSAIFEAKDRKRLADGLENVFDHPATLHLSVESSASFGRKQLSGEMMFLPLRSDLGEISRALGVVVMDGPIGRTPRRIRIARESRRGLVGFGGPDAAQHRQFEPELPPQPPRTQRTLSQHLRLVADNTKQDA